MSQLMALRALTWGDGGIWNARSNFIKGFEEVKALKMIILCSEKEAINICERHLGVSFIVLIV